MIQNSVITIINNQEIPWVEKDDEYLKNVRREGKIL